MMVPNFLAAKGLANSPVGMNDGKPLSIGNLLVPAKRGAFHARQATADKLLEAGRNSVDFFDLIHNHRSPFDLCSLVASSRCSILICNPGSSAAAINPILAVSRHDLLHGVAN